MASKTTSVISGSLIVPWQQPIVKANPTGSSPLGRGPVGGQPPVLGGLNVQPGIVPPIWQAFFQNLVNALVTMPLIIGTVDTTAHAAAIPTTNVSAPLFTGNLLSAGLYRLSYYARVARASGATSGIQVTLGWTSGGVAQPHVGANLTGNTTTTAEQFSAIVRVDDSTAITYAVSYASTGAPTMEFDFALTLEQLPEAA